MSSTILVVEDDRMTVDLIETYLRRERFCVISTANGYSALELVRTKTPDLIILDLMLPQIDGLDICRLLRAQSDVPIIMLTARATEEDVLTGLHVGADDYIKKPFSPRELVARVHTVLRRHRSDGRDQEELSFGDLRVNFIRHEVFVNNQPVNLTASEFKLLGVLAREPGRVFSRSDLLERLRGLENNSLERTIDFHMMNLRRKIEPDAATPRFIQTVFGVGYKFATDAAHL
jgi:DNA-binding response OmpR family regulator